MILDYFFQQNIYSVLSEFLNDRDEGEEIYCNVHATGKN